MHKFFIILLTTILFLPQAYGANIVYPKKSEVTINAPRTFFIGNEQEEKLKINNDEVKIYKTGAFKHAVELDYGENTFVIDNGKEKLIYKIFRNTIEPTAKTEENFIELTSNENPDFKNIVRENAKEGRLRITIDPGHGGKEYGAIGCLGEKEKDINLEIAMMLRDKLKNTGVQVFMTREDDTFVGLRERVNFANNNNSHIFISIHSNALPDSLANKEIRGSEVYYLYPQAKELAQNILRSLTEECLMNSHGIYQRNFAVVRNPNAISVLVEIGYVIDPQDEEKLINKDFQNSAADAILKGLENYLK